MMRKSGGAQKKLQENDSNLCNAFKKMTIKKKNSSKVTFNGGRMFGSFQCNKCKRTWKSGASWQNMRQKCKKCRIYVFPYQLEPLEIGSGKNSKQPHPEELCEMCQKLGRQCNL